MQDQNLQDLKMRDKMSGLETTWRENAETPRLLVSLFSGCVEVFEQAWPPGPKIVCFLTQSVQLTLSSVQLTLLECVMWSSKMQWRFLTEMIRTDIDSKWMKNYGRKSIFCLEIVEKMNRFALLNFKIFWGQCPQTPILGRGYGAPVQTPPPSALRASVPRSGPSAPPSSLSVCGWHSEIF